MRFAVLQLTGCAGCEVSLLNAGDELDLANLAYMPLVVTAHDVPEVDVLLVTGGIRTDEDLLKLRESASRVKKIIAVGTCAISGGVAGLGDRHDIRELFLASTHHGRVPRMLPKCSPIDTEVKVDYYLPGCPPVPKLYVALLNDPESLKTTSIVCKECGRKKPKEIRPDKLSDAVHKDVDHDLCLVKQGQLCVGTSTRNGCGAICPKAGFPCVGCRGPSNNLIEKDANAWFESLIRVFERMTDIDPEEISKALKSPHLALFLFQFSDYTDTELDSRPKEKVL
jgi:F420-non-reducing hydrogenase small subunit